MSGQSWSTLQWFGLPLLKTNIDKIEMVQHKAARFVFNDYHRYSSVSHMLQQLNWDSLEHRRTNAIIVMFYKIINNIVSVCTLTSICYTVDFSNFLHRSFSKTRGHDMRFLTIDRFSGKVCHYITSFSIMHSRFL